MSKTYRKVTTVTHELIISRSDILRMVGGEIPKDAKVSFEVPRGGDYSGDVLELDDDDLVLTISWSEHEDG